MLTVWRAECTLALRPLLADACLQMEHIQSHGAVLECFNQLSGMRVPWLVIGMRPLRNTSPVRVRVNRRTQHAVLLQPAGSDSVYRRKHTTGIIVYIHVHYEHIWSHEELDQHGLTQT
jgi:hypothetical protein